MATKKFDIMRQVKMKTILTQSSLHKALLGEDRKPTTMDKDKRTETDEKALSTIQLCLSNEVLREVLDQKTAKGL
jgi:hypothetical protein